MRQEKLLSTCMRRVPPKLHLRQEECLTRGTPPASARRKALRQELEASPKSG
jgi:hypothetical protein